MGVYIQKMTMPQNCSFCPCARMNVSRNGIECSAVDFYAENLMPQKGRMECCPLVEVKPHGRLIDADAFEYTCKFNYCNGCEDWNGLKCKTCWVDDMLGELENAPTIIESEGEDG